MSSPMRRRPRTNASKLSPQTPVSTRSLTQLPEAHGGRDDLRRTIAHRAARLIAEGLTDYHAAKVKAAKQLNVSVKQSLPDNHEIEAALREHYALFAGETQPQALAQLRDAALKAMRWLAEFDPWIAGAVLNGTANEMSVIELELIGVSAKAFEMFLLNENVTFDLQEHPINSASARNFKTIVYELEWRDWPIEVALFESHAARQSIRPGESVKHGRLRIGEAENLFSSGAKAR
jgi:hypothetical protein